jgi:ELWxxDGT repeat protein
MTTRFFFVSNRTGDTELSVFDGNGTPRVTGINPNAGYVSGYNVLSTLRPVGKSLFFWANNGTTNGTELWRYDGSAATMSIGDIRLGSNAESWRAVPRTPETCPMGTLKLDATEGGRA